VRWEYHYLYVRTDGHPAAWYEDGDKQRAPIWPRLNAGGEQGWELFSVIPEIQAHRIVLLLRRPVDAQ
jgi:hypothetical protein